MWHIISKNVDKSHLILEFFTSSLVSNASAQLLADITLSSFTFFLPALLNLEGPWEVASSETSFPSKYRNVGEAKFLFF